MKKFKHIKLFESLKIHQLFPYQEQEKLKQDINDVLVEIADLGFRWEVYISKNMINWYVTVDITKEGEEDWEDPDYGIADIYESAMMLVGFMRDKYPDVQVRYELASTYNESEIDEFLEENDLETIEDISDTPMDAIYNFQVNFSGNFDFRKNK
jgi:hypothetical protein